MQKGHRRYCAMGYSNTPPGTAARLASKRNRRFVPDCGGVTSPKAKCPLCADRGFLQWKHPNTARVGCQRCRRKPPKRADATARAEQILDELLGKELTGGRRHA